jgi:hypothetical protein
MNEQNSWNYFANIHKIQKKMLDEYLYNSIDVRIQVLKGILEYQKKFQPIPSYSNNYSFDDWVDNNYFNPMNSMKKPYIFHFNNTQKRQDCEFLIRSLGFLTTKVHSNYKQFKTWFQHHCYSYSISVRYIGWGTYYGFEIDGNKRFVLGDFSVTHNTSLIKNGLAKSLNLPFQLIALGGCNDSSILEGHNYTYEGSTWGRIAQAIIDSKCMNPILLMDELDKIGGTYSSKSSENITGILTHLTDHTQNTDFRDRYFSDIDIDLSKVFFIFSFNNEEEVNKILRDRMYIIRLKGFKKTEKIQIAKQYFIQEMEEIFHLHNCIIWKDSVIDWLIQNYCMEEEGVRNLKRKIESVYRTLNMLRYIESIPKSQNNNSDVKENEYEYIQKWTKLVQFPIVFPLTLNTNMIQEMIEWQDSKDAYERNKIIQNMFL